MVWNVDGVVVIVGCENLLERNVVEEVGKMSCTKYGEKCIMYYVLWPCYSRIRGYYVLYLNLFVKIL